MEFQREELEKLYSESFRRLEEGAILKGKILKVNNDGVIVDIGYKSEGFIPIEEFTEDELSTIQPDDEIEVYVSGIRDSEGTVNLSREKALKIKTWDLIDEAMAKGSPIEGKVVGKVKGGLSVDISGVKAFLPGSQIDLKAVRDTNRLMGQVLSFKVLKVNPRRSNIIISRRAILEEERRKLKEDTLLKIKEGAIVNGVVKNITDYGAFIDLGGIDGLLHISDMSWGRIGHPSELFKVGDNVEVMVLKFDSDNERVTLGYKQKKQDPWLTVQEKHPVGKKIKGRVINITDYGAFVEIEDGLEGLVHVTEMDWSEKLKHPSKYVSEGDEVEAVVIKIEKEERRISLSIRRLKPSPWELVAQRYRVGQKIAGRVRSFTEFGAFIGLDEGVDALLHISDMSWTRHIKHPSEILKKGQKIEAIVINIEPEKERMALGIKQLTPDPWLEEIPMTFRLSDRVKGKVVKIADFGIFIELEGGVEGLIYSSEIEKPASKKLEEIAKIGDELEARIIKVDTSERKIGLSMRSREEGR